MPTMKQSFRFGFCVLASCLLTSVSSAQDLLVEAESFESAGGWKLDTQFIEIMGSPYLLAHGLGTPVENATTTVTFPETGQYNVWVRTKDWVAQWNAPGTPGRFNLSVDGVACTETFGTVGADWHWQPGGKVSVSKLKTELALHDLTGFDGRCDAIYFSKSDSAPPNSSEILSGWRRERLGLQETPTDMSGYDLVVVGGGYSGLGSAISAARMGCKVALIQNRPVLGGNGSSEVRVWSMGLIRRGKYPRVGEIIEEICDHAKKSPGTYEEFEDDKKETIVRAEENIDLFLNHHMYKVDREGEKIAAVYAFDTRTSEHKRFAGSLFVDATGHGTVGYLAKADWEMTPKGRMGMSNMWAWDEKKEPVDFPETPWALQMNMADFPYPRDHHGQWFWEGGFDKNPITEAEAIRDWNLRAVFGAFNAMKNGDGASDHANAFMTWVAYIGGPRESRRILGDVILNQDDIVAKKEFPDGCVPSTWSIDLHYPKKQYAEKFPDNPFISYAVHDRRIDRAYGYPVPYRCFYSRNIPNLFMAGRCISVTHQALGTVRVMKTCGMMGEVVGRAASICTAHDCLPRDVYEDHWPEMVELLNLPGKAYRKTVVDEITIPDDAMELAGPRGIPKGKNPKKLGGPAMDDYHAKKTGSWQTGSGLKGYVADGYIYSSDADATVEFTVKADKAGQYDLRYSYGTHQNRGSRVSINVTAAGKSSETQINMKKAPDEDGFCSLGKYTLDQGDEVKVLVSAKNAGGFAHADAVLLKPIN